MPKAFERSGMLSLYDFYVNQFLHFDGNKPIKPIKPLRLKQRFVLIDDVHSFS